MQVLKIVSPWNPAPVYHKSVTASTMEDAALLLESPVAHGTVITADFQTRGRGRFSDRKWKAEKGENLLFTVILHQDQLKQTEALLPLVSGLALAFALEKLYLLPTQVKWPNDIYSNGKKVAGILCQRKKDFLLVGMGINCNQECFPRQLTGAASLSWFLKRPVDRHALLEEVLASLRRVLAENVWHKALEERLYLRGRACQIACYRGSVLKELQGIITGIGNNGELKFQPDGEEKEMLLLSAEIRAIS